MFLSIVFLLPILVYGRCHLVREDGNVVEKRAASSLPISPDCSAFTNGQLADNVSRTMHEDIVAALQQPGSKAKALAGGQFAFLYFHGTAPNGRFIEDTYVRNTLSLTAGYNIPFVNGYWPGKSIENNNFLLGAPSRSAIGVKDSNVGHAEYNLLQHLPKMFKGYLQRHKTPQETSICPCYVILGTVRPPCHYQILNQPATGCAVDYATAKDDFAKICPKIAFYLFVHRAPEPAYKVGWEYTKELYLTKGIRIIQNFQET